MTHARDILLDRVKDLISTNGVTVRRSRAYPADSKSYPFYAVFWDDEQILWEQSTKQGTFREMQVIVEAVRQIVVGDDDEEKIERRMQDDLDYLESLLERPEIEGAIDARLQSTKLMMNTSGEVPLGIAALTLIVQYRTLPGNARILT